VAGDWQRARFDQPSNRPLVGTVIVAQLTKPESDDMSSTASGARLHVSLPRIGSIVIGLSAAIFFLGVVRELFIAHFGTETPLQDLRQIALDVEHSAAAYYSALLLLACAAMLFTISRLVRRDGGHDVQRWTLLAVIFAAMSMDEAVSFHEVLITPLRETFGLSGMFYFAWVIPGAILVALLGLYYLPFLLRLPRRSALLFVLAGVIYVGGALGMELVAGFLADAHGSMTATPYLVATVIEEGMEVAGLTIFFLALTSYVSWGWPTVVLRIETGRGSGW
jgi:hypothetical protein